MKSTHCLKNLMLEVVKLAFRQDVPVMARAVASFASRTARQALSIIMCSGLLAAAAMAHAADKPNIILFIGDDIGWNDFGCYGNKAARTPNIDQLAAHGLRFTNAFLTASSCSPSRCSIITGRYPHNNGHAAELHRPMPAHLPLFPSLLREAGYYTALSGKDHMPQDPAGADAIQHMAPFQHKDNGRIAGNSGGHANWVKLVSERPKDKPFLFWFASHDAHRGWDADRQWNTELYGPPHQADEVIVPPFLADTPDTRADLASYYNEVTRMDYYIGAVVAELKRQSVLDNTLIFVMADNGRPFPRAKTRLHDSGMKTAFVVHWPAGIAGQGATAAGLVSAIDIAPTVLSAAGIQTPDTCQGLPIQPVFADASAKTRTAVFSEHNWHDYEAHGRSVRSEGFLYIKNSRPYQAWQGPADSVRSPSHRDLIALRGEGKLSAPQQDVFLAPRPAEELYDLRKDPHQLVNLASSAESEAIKSRLQGLMEDWQQATGDTVPERLSRDQFDRETGEMLIKDRNEVYGTTPGEERDAARINRRGPT